MGLYRFVLAIAVVLSHLGISAFGFNIGVVAVISFFILSGYVMTGLILRYYNHSKALPLFYLDRLARLYPQFFFYSLLSLIVVLSLNPKSPFLTGVTPGKLALNFLLIPNGFYMLGDLETSMLIHPSWSLGLEACFYLVFPILLLKDWRMIAYFVSIGFFILAFSGLLDTNYFGYRLLPGTLFMFLWGSFAFNSRLPKYAGILLFGTWVGVCLLLFICLENPSLQVPNNKEVILGLVIGLPTVWLLRGIGFSSLDKLIGNLSYGVFLNHTILIWILQSAWGIGPTEFNFKQVLILLVVSSICAWISYQLIEKPVLAQRRKWRLRGSAES